MSAVLPVQLTHTHVLFVARQARGKQELLVSLQGVCAAVQELLLRLSDFIVARPSQLLHWLSVTQCVAGTRPQDGKSGHVYALQSVAQLSLEAVEADYAHNAVCLAY